ncbi:signal peptidase II [uncultured Campylobacter sp.]|uniref:signal peptidase II n=1 Tax=uncultured Campylobacter sp. TaxID=218934 RepID=UPI002623AD96|nr:signal peptidase II [uncultured Campylobacter sp.]
MARILVKFGLILVAVLIADQLVKQLFIDGFRWRGDYFSLVLAYNDGVAFSLFAKLGWTLKFIQLGLIILIALYLAYEKKFLQHHFIALGLIFGAGISNLLDRFVHGGVVDYLYWHRWFSFPIFNLADVIINIGVALIILNELFFKKSS